MYELSDEEFTRIVVRKVEELKLNVLLDNPDIAAEYPCVVCNNTYSNILLCENNMPVQTRFQINLEAWATSKYETMNIMNKIIIKLRELNIAPVGNPTEMHDEITNKHRRMRSFEVFFNGLTNSFDRTK